MASIFAKVPPIFCQGQPLKLEGRRLKTLFNRPLTKKRFLTNELQGISIPIRKKKKNAARCAWARRWLLLIAPRA